jgi:hypothetical protein
MRSAFQGSNGKVMVPEPTYRRVPSNSHIVEPWPEKPRAAIDVPPLPGPGDMVMPVLRATASSVVTSPRSRTVSPRSTSMLAGVCKGVMPRRLPVEAGSFSAPGAAALLRTRTSGSVSADGACGCVGAWAWAWAWPSAGTARREKAAAILLARVEAPRRRRMSFISALKRPATPQAMRCVEKPG